MATISFSDSVRKYLASDVFATIETMRLMKGTVPTDFADLTSTSSRTDDILIEFPVINDTSVGTGYKSYSNTYYTALQSGTATWLWGYDSSGITLVWQFVGTVGTAGTDLIIGDTAIIAGAKYRLVDIVFEFPQNYTY